jgi:menaquinone-specific isochorismate synthase
VASAETVPDAVPPAPVAVAGTFVRTVPVDENVSEAAASLVERLPPGAPLAWVRAGEGMVGWGVAAQVELKGPDQVTAAQAWWSEWLAGVDVEDGVQVAGSGPVAFASFAFDAERATSAVVIPRVLLGRRDGRTWLTVVGTRGADPDADPLAVLGPVVAPQPPSQVSWSEGSLTAAQWQAAVRQAVAAIVAGDLDKVVLARDLVATTSAPVDQRVLLRRLADRYPSCWTFAVDGLVGATPELLVRRAGSTVLSRVLAGTVGRLGDDAADGELADALLGSEKDLEEHELAVHSVAAVLAAHCDRLEVPERPTVLRLRNVQHLATDVSGHLADSSGVLDLVGALHPTAAVCGTPTSVALEVIRDLEGMDRGRYAGPVGWMGAAGDGEFGIALRCAEVDGSRLRLFAGCGIVAGSDPDAELTEAQAKLVPIRDALESSD